MYEWEKKISEILIQAQREARREGIESVKINSIARITKHKERCSESGYSLVEFTEGLEVGIKVITEEAERLKEQGK